MNMARGGSKVMRVGCLNVRGANAEIKKGEVGLIFRERNLDVLALTETKLKGEGNIDFGGFNGSFSGVNERVRAREGVAIIMKDEWWRCVREFKRVNPRLMWVRLKLSKESWVFVCAYAPVSGGNEREREAFWEELNECLGSLNKTDRVCVLGDLNARVGNTRVNRVVGPFGVEGINENGEMLIDLCVEKKFMIGNTWFEKQSIHKYTWVSGVNGERALLDYVCVEQRIKDRLLDVNVLRGAAGGISDHFLVEARVRIKGGWNKRESRSEVVEIIKVERLDDMEYKEMYKRKMIEKWGSLNKSGGNGVEEQWRVLKETVDEVARDVCGVKRVGEKEKRKGSEWWSGELENLVKKKREAFEHYLGVKSVEAWEMYKERNREVKRAVRYAKRRADENWSMKIVDGYKEKSKMFWKEVNKARKKRDNMCGMIKDILTSC